MAAVIRSRRCLLLMAFVWLTATGGVFSGCSRLFRPAEPEPPSGNPILPNYTSPEATLQTLVLAIADKARTNGAAAYVGAFADSTSPSTPAFHQYFAPAVVTRWEQTSGRKAPSDWSLPLEQNFYAYFVNLRSEDYFLEWLPDETRPDPPPGEQEAEVHRRYRVLTLSADGNSTALIAVGFADLVFHKASGNRWVIRRWDDRVDPDVGVNPADPQHLSLGARRLESQ